jgi:hypothetical protein
MAWAQEGNAMNEALITNAVNLYFEEKRLSSMHLIQRGNETGNQFAERQHDLDNTFIAASYGLDRLLDEMTYDERTEYLHRVRAKEGN